MADSSLVYLVLQSINIAIAIFFVIFFIIRLIKLKSMAMTSRSFVSYIKTRVILSVTYCILSFVLLIYYLVQKIYPYASQGYMYVLSGGGGQVINSGILLLQLGVFRYEIVKQIKLTFVHTIYSFYLLLISIVRFILTVYFWLSISQQTTQLIIFDFIISILMCVDTFALLVFWVKNAESLPDFQNDVRKFVDNKLLLFKPQKSRMHSYGKQLSEEQFPQIFATVNVEKNKFRVICEIWANNRIISFEDTENNRQSSSNKHLEIIAQTVYTVEQIKQFYIECGRFTLQSRLTFTDTTYFQISNKFQRFLNELLAEPFNYLRFVLQFLNIPEQNIKQFQKILKKRELGKSKYSTENIREDINATYLSVTIYKQLWIDDHYQFYLKVLTPDQLIKSYPMKRYKEFQQLDIQLKRIANEKKINHWKMIIPTLPKKHYLLMDNQKIQQRKRQLQLYIRKICNDRAIIQCPQMRDCIIKFLDIQKVLSLTGNFKKQYFKGLDIKKGNITKALIDDEYVTMYEFKLFNNGIEFLKITKRFRQFVNLHQDIERWMNNIQIRYQIVQLPQRHLYKSEEHRHEKLKAYLVSVINLPKCEQIYSLGTFLNISGDADGQPGSLFSEITTGYRKRQESVMISKRQNEHGNSPKSPSQKKKREENSWVQMRDSSPSADKRWSALIDDLGISSRQQ